ncbi:MAG: hypothetical protein HY203_03390 [Nitrospirae bacterium]|nr:hypothetical protein [Nitrospirota bacterium]
MTPRHIYDAEGYWVAFVVGTEVFLRGGEWLGRLSDHHEIRDQDGQLQGFMDDDGRLLILESESVRMNVPVRVTSREAERGTEKVR